MLRIFGPAAALTAAAIVFAGTVAGLAAMVAVIVLGVLEVSVSFDNAVVNAKVLGRMNPFWQKMFLTVGILIAVVGMRLVLPILLVSVTAGLSPFAVTDMALNNPDAYAHQVEGAAEAIYAFGGTFLLMIFLDFALDPDRDIHWLKPIEKPLAAIGKLDTLAAAIALTAVFGASQIADPAKTTTVLIAGIFGLVSYLLVSGLDTLMNPEDDEDGEETPGVDVKKIAAGASLAAFLYLEVLDASFSFDGVIGAFAISHDILIIALGLGIGALWVRSLTVYLVRKGTLAELIYLEHGAHWAIGALAGIMLLEMKYEVSEYVTGGLGVVFIGLALISSLIERKRQPELADELSAAMASDEDSSETVTV